MATRVTITGTGTPEHRPERAGPGVLVRTDEASLLFDAGRGAVMRLAAAGQSLPGLDALFVTHHHSDHLVGVPDLVMTRWLDDIERAGLPPLPVYAPDGEAVSILDGILGIWQNEMAMRRDHTGRPDVAAMDVRRFDAGKQVPVEVASIGDAVVSAVAVEHDPVVPSVGYRVETGDGAVVVSGDTAVCPQVEALASGADVLVHEAMLGGALAGVVSDPAALSAYHSECSDIGALAERAAVGTLILTHLLPPPDSPHEVDAFTEGIRSGGYQGRVIVADDLDEVTVG